jgi:hypothetical protein
MAKRRSKQVKQRKRSMPASAPAIVEKSGPIQPGELIWTDKQIDLNPPIIGVFKSMSEDGKLLTLETREGKTVFITTRNTMIRRATNDERS